jgi:hypothetical protein
MTKADLCFIDVSLRLLYSRQTAKVTKLKDYSFQAISGWKCEA